MSDEPTAPEPQADAAPEAKPEVPTAPITIDPAPKADAAPEPAVVPVDPTAAVNRRVSLLRSADLVLDSVDDGAADEVIQLAVIAKVDGAEAIVGADKWSEDYRAATFDAAVRSHKREAARPTIDTAAQIARMTGRDAADAEKPSGMAGVFAKYDADLRENHRKPTAHQEPRKGL